MGVFRLRSVDQSQGERLHKHFSSTHLETSCSENQPEYGSQTMRVEEGNVEANLNFAPLLDTVPKDSKHAMNKQVE